MARILELLLISRLFIDFFSEGSPVGQLWAVASILLYVFCKLVLRKRINIFDKFIFIVLVAIIPSLVFNNIIFKETLLFTLKYLVPVMYGSMIVSISYKPSKFFIRSIYLYLIGVTLFILNVYTNAGFDIAYVNKHKNQLFLSPHTISQGLVKIFILYFLFDRYFSRIRMPNWFYLAVMMLVLSLHVRSSILALLLLMPFVFKFNKKYQKIFNFSIVVVGIYMFWELILAILSRFISPEKLTLTEFSAGRTLIWEIHLKAMNTADWLFGRGVTFVTKLSHDRILNLSLHNDFLQILVTFGIPVCLVIIYLFYKLFKRLDLPKEQLLIMLLPIIALSMTNGMLFHQNTVLLFFVMGIILRIKNYALIRSGASKQPLATGYHRGFQPGYSRK